MKMILENYKYTADCNSQTVKETIKHANHSDKDENENVTPKKDDKKKSLNDIPQFSKPFWCITNVHWW